MHTQSFSVTHTPWTYTTLWDLPQYSLSLTHTHSHTRTQALHDTFGTPPNTFSTPCPAHFKSLPTFSHTTPSLPTPTRFSRSCFFAGFELRPLYATTKYKSSKVSSTVIKHGIFSSELTFSGTHVYESWHTKFPPVRSSARLRYSVLALQILKKSSRY